MKMKLIPLCLAAMCASCVMMRDLTRTDVPLLQQVPFVERWRELHGQWIDEGIAGGMNIDFPTYGLDEASRTLTDYGRPGIDTNAPWVFLFGSGQSNHSDAGGGAASKLYPLFSLPCTTNGVTFISAEPNGTVALRCWDELHTLVPGDVARHETTWVHTNVYGDRSFRIRFTAKERIQNYGLIDRNNVRRGR